MFGKDGDRIAATPVQGIIGATQTDVEGSITLARLASRSDVDVD